MRSRRLLTRFEARNVCCSIFFSSRYFGSSSRGLGEQQLRVRRDAGERRVDLVRDAGGEQAERGQTLLVLQLALEAHAVGDVADDQHARAVVVDVARRESGLAVTVTSFSTPCRLMKCVECVRAVGLTQLGVRREERRRSVSSE